MLTTFTDKKIIVTSLRRYVVTCLICLLFFDSHGYAGQSKTGSSDVGTGGNNPTQIQETPRPVDRNLNALLYGRYDSVIKSVETQYSCKPLKSDPKARAQDLMQKFELPRNGEMIKYQSFCWESAEITIRDLEGKDGALANSLRLKLKTNRESIKIQAAVDTCPGEDTEFRNRLKKQLEVAAPFENIFRSGPVKVPPEVSEQESLRQIRDSIYTESLTEALERSIVLAKTHGLGFSDIVDKICPANSACAQGKHLRDIRSLLQSRYEDLKGSDIPKKSDGQVYLDLQNAIRRMDQVGKKFNSQLSCRDVGTPMTGSNRICDSKSEYKKTLTCPESACANPEKKAADAAADKTAEMLNRQYYDQVDDILGSDEGSLLGHEPFKTQLKTMYGGIPVKLNGETNYVFFKKHNEPPGWDSLSGKTAWRELPSDLRLLGGSQTVHEAAVNALSNTGKYAAELNKIEDSISKGRNPDYGIFSSGDSEIKGLALMARLNPSATARILLSNPQLAKTGVVCRMISAGGQFEKDKDIEGKIQSVLGLGTIAVGVAATLLPTGVTQVAGPALTAFGTTLALGGTTISAKNAYDNHLTANRTSAAYSATKNTDLKYDSEKATSEMINSAAQVVGDAAAPIFIKGLTSGASPERMLINKAILQEAESGTKTGQYALRAIKSPELEGAILAKLKGASELHAIDEAARLNPDGFKKIIEKFNGLCKVALLEDSALISKVAVLWQIIVSHAQAADFGCSFAELDNLMVELRRFAGFDSAIIGPGDWVSVDRSDGTLSNAKVEIIIGDRALVTFYDNSTGQWMEKSVDLHKLGNMYNGYGAQSVPKESWRTQASGTAVNYQSVSGRNYTGRYVAETKDYVFVKGLEKDAVTGLKKQRLVDFAFVEGESVNFKRSSGEQWFGKIYSINPDGTATVNFIDEFGRHARKDIPLGDLGKRIRFTGNGKKANTPPNENDQQAKKPETPNNPKPPESPFPPRRQTPEQVARFQKAESEFPTARMSKTDQVNFFDDVRTFKQYGGAELKNKLVSKANNALGLDPNKNYSASELKNRFRELVKSYHPDNAVDYADYHGLSLKEAQKILGDQTSFVNSIYDVLKDISK